jgi:hypothetical protein
MAMIVLVTGLVARSVAVQRTGCLLVFVATLSVWPVIQSGHAGYHRAYSLEYETGQQWLDVHEHRAERVAWLFYVTAAVSAAALGVSWKQPRLTHWLTLGVAVLSLAGLGAGAWVARAGGQVRHGEFRSGPPPALSEGQHHPDP